MKKIIRLTESDLTRIVRRVLKENEENTKTIEDFEELKGYVGMPVTPLIYKTKDDISLNFKNNQKRTNFQVGYINESPNVFDMIISANPKDGLCEKVKSACLFIEKQGTNETNKFRSDSDNCGCMNYFNISNFDKIPSLVKGVYKILNS